MAEISTTEELATLINVFTVDPSNQEKLVKMLIEATDKTMRKIPGFISASIHKSHDGTRVTNYAQWRSADEYAAMLKNPEAVKHMQPIMDIATFDAHLYKVVESLSL